jgi:hypothetical protein
MRRQGAVALLSFLIVQWVLSTLASAQTTIIPSLTVSERYDSNIYWAPKATLSPGTKAEDFITMVVPQMTIAQAGSLMRGSITGTGLVNKYINNPDRDFTGWNVSGQLDLTNAAHQVSQRITALTMRGTFVDTPAGSGFAAAGGGLNTGFGAEPGVGAGAALNSGIVTNRASRQVYTLGVAGGYQLTGLTSLTASYTYTNISFGNQQGGANNPLFNTTGHTGSMGISTRISPRDTVGAFSAMSHYIQDQSSGGSGQGSYTTLTETLNWNRQWTQELNTSLGGGANLSLPVGSDIPGQSQELEVRPTVTARMTYSSYLDELRDAGASFDSLPSLAGSLGPGGIMVPGAYRVLMAYRYSFVPSYAFSSGPSQAHVLGLTVMGGITSKLTGQVGMNYAHRNTLSGPSSTGDTVGLTGGVRYLLGPVLASLTANWLYVSNSTTQTPVYEFSKEVVMLSFSYAFLSPAFFYEDVSLPSSIGTGTSPSGAGSETLGKE